MTRMHRRTITSLLLNNLADRVRPFSPIQFSTLLETKVAKTWAPKLSKLKWQRKRTSHHHLAFKPIHNLKMIKEISDEN